MQITRFKTVLFMLNRFDRLKPQHTEQVNRFNPVVFMLNRFDRLKHLYNMHINLFSIGLIHF